MVGIVIDMIMNRGSIEVIGYIDIGGRGREGEVGE